jgi:hypothetical protein
MPLARADLETLLRTRRLDHTLTTALPLVPAGRSFDDDCVGATGVARLDARLAGGFPRGQLSEIVGDRSSGRTSLLLRMLAAATARGELTALVDVIDMLDVESAAAAGVELDRLLWIRGHLVINPGLCRDRNQRAMEQAIRALALVLSSGHFGLVVFDVADAPIEVVRRVPFTTWLRLQRMVEGRPTSCVLAGIEQMARSAAGLTVRVGQVGRVGRVGIPHSQSGTGARFRGRLFEGLTVEARVVRARARMCDDVAVTVETKMSGDG